MSANDNKRYFWLKLNKDFFHGYKIKVLKSLPNGRLYALIYLELLAESTSHNGELRFSELLPYDTVTLAAVLDEDKDNVEKAIETLIKLELVEIIDDGTLYMREISRLIGSETGQTKRKREARLDGGKSYPRITLENRDKSTEIRDKKRFTPPTIEEVKAYCEERKNNVDYKKFYEYYSIADWKDSKGQPVKNWKQKMIANWERNATKTERSDIIPEYNESNNPQYDEERFNEIMNRRKNVS
jgi:predicted phage replisome organizer